MTTRLMVSRAHRNGTVGIRLAMAAFENAFQARGRFDFIDCYQCLKPLFEKLGYRQIHKNHTHPDFGEAVPMLLGNADRRHLASVTSPFLKVIHRYPEDKGTTILSVESIKAGEFTVPANAQGKQPPPCHDVPAFCRVLPSAKRTNDSHIKIEVWLPVTGWNGELHGFGNGLLGGGSGRNPIQFANGEFSH